MSFPFGRKFKLAYWSLAILGGLWAVFVTSLTNPIVQRHALYAHRLHSAWWQDIDKPERWGFLKNQIRPFNITTPDGEILYAWHIIPLAAYHKHASKLVASDPLNEDVTSSAAFDILTTDPEARLVISFHGNAGHVGQGWRTDAYRALSVGASDKIHVLAIDYRGFGRSTGVPSEEGLIVDGVAAADWALNAGVPPERIALVGQSLGTAVATAVAEHFAVVRKVEFAGVGLIAPFSDLVKLLATYAIGGFIPILSPLKGYPRLRKFVEERVVDTWHTESRLGSFVKASKAVNLVLVHAYDDFDIHWSHSDTLFYAAANATSEEGMSKDQIDAVKHKEDLGPQGAISTWKAGANGLTKKIKHVFVKHGGHNRITTYPAVSNAVLDLFGL